MSQQKAVSITPHDEIVLAAVHCAEMDEERTRQMHDGVLAAAAEARHLPVVLDLSEVEFLPSLSIGALVGLLTELKKAGQRFILVGIQPLVRETLAVTRLDRVFDIHDTVDEALEEIRQA
jgi:anti-sigma B factor antagonist